MPASQVQALLDFFHEPVLVLGVDGVVVEANGAARRTVGVEPVGRDLATFLASPKEDFRAWLHRCSGTTAPLVGALQFLSPDGASRHVSLRGARLRPSDETVQIAIRFVEVEPRRFLLLKQEVEELNAKARESMRREAVLAEALRNNQAMLRELNHRVKNNIQLMVGMLSATARETSSPEVRDAIGSAVGRLLAVGVAQKVMYETPEVTTVPASVLLQALVDTVAGAQGRDLHLELDVAESRLPNELAFPLSIIVNELVTDPGGAVSSCGKGARRIAFLRRGDEFSLTVHGDGPLVAASAPERRSSGLGLLRGLCSQIGGRMEVADGGAQVTLRFTCPQPDARG